MSMAAVHHDGAVTVISMTILKCVGVWETAGQEIIEGRQSSGGVQGVKGCVESGRLLMCSTKCMSMAAVHHDGAKSEMFRGVGFCWATNN